MTQALEVQPVLKNILVLEDVEVALTIGVRKLCSGAYFPEILVPPLKEIGMSSEVRVHHTYR